MGRILLVEDEPNLRYLMEDILRFDRHLVDAVPSLLIGRLFLAANSYDLLLADKVLGDGSGLDLADAAKRRGIRTLIVTAYPFSFPDERLNEYRFIAKPVRAVALLAEVRRRLASARS